MKHVEIEEAQYGEQQLLLLWVYGSGAGWQAADETKRPADRQVIMARIPLPLLPLPLPRRLLLMMINNNCRIDFP